MFSTLSEKLEGVLRRLSGNATLSESNIKDALVEVRSALLEADVAYEVTEAFCARVAQKFVGQEVTQGVKPGQEFIKAVYDELVRMLGGDEAVAASDAGKSSAPDPILSIIPGPCVVMLAGLQGSGKTTTCGKLALHLAKKGKRVVMAAVDLQRPAAVTQLQILSQQVAAMPDGLNKVFFYGEPDKCAAYGQAVGVAVDVAKRALAFAREQKADVLLLDTAGRLHINDDLMGELKQVAQATQPHHIFLALDAMTGQDAVKSAKSFDAQLELDGVILTKFDSDTRGGAALSVREVTGRKLVFVGTGEKLDALEIFHAPRAAGRILGMGDVVSLVEKAQEQVSEAEMAAMEEKMLSGKMDLNDFLDNMQKMRRMGPMKNMLGMLPGIGGKIKDLNINEKDIDRQMAIVRAMTAAERKNPELLDNSRRRRIAKGAGMKQEDVSKLIKGFEQMKMMTQMMGSMGRGGRMDALAGMDQKQLMKMAQSGGLKGLMAPPAPTAPRFKQRKR